jgi:hypothetical protein
MKPFSQFAFHLTQDQLDIAHSPGSSRIFLEGRAGCGKTTAAVERMVYLMSAGVPGGSILVLLPQRTLAGPYFQALQHPGLIASGIPAVVTVGGLAQRMVDLFWPLVAQRAGFAHPDRPPVFLTLETAQYYMAHLVRPLLDEGDFSSVILDRNRLYSQILDDLNKAAVVGFPHSEIGLRLKEAWSGEAGQLNVYNDVQKCASLFRQYCLAHNLLDFSLQFEIFRDLIWPDADCRSYLLRIYRHLIFDNIEEDTPVAHDLVRQWLTELDSALLVYDWQAGYRRFLGADPVSANFLKAECNHQAEMTSSFVNSPALVNLGEGLFQVINPENLSERRGSKGSDSLKKEQVNLATQAITISFSRLYPEMLDWVANQIRGLVYDEGISPGEIVVLAPYLSDALRFALSHRLNELQVPVRSYRPSRSLREEPAARCLLTLARLAHPEWKLAVTKYDVAYALMQAIEGMDLVRAKLLADVVYRVKEGMPALSTFDEMRSEMRERITYVLGERYETLRAWLIYERIPPDEFDYFLSRIFGEVLSQPGFGFHTDLTAGQVTANLIESVQKFRWVAGDILDEEGIPLGKEYLEMVDEGVIAAQYIQSWLDKTGDAVLLSPAYTFLLSNRPVDFQFWLDAGSRGWSERLEQPLTQPYVLSRNWPEGRIWSDYDEVVVGREQLSNLVTGLISRCRRQIYLGLSKLGEQGYEDRGPLLQAVQRIKRWSIHAV